MYVCIYTSLSLSLSLYIYICIYIYIYIYMLRPLSPSLPPSLKRACTDTRRRAANLRFKITDSRGFDSSRISIVRVEFPCP